MARAATSPPLEPLAGVSLFRGLSREALTAIAELARPRRVPRAGFFFHQGDAGAALYVLQQGQVRLTQLAPDGHEILLRFIYPGEMFGGIAVLGDAVYPVSAEAAEESRALAWDGETVAQLMERHPRMALNALHLLAERIQDLQSRYRELATERVERRIARALLRLAQQSGRKVERGILIDLSLSRQDLAEMTGTTLYTVSRTLSRWEQEGLVEAGRESVLIRSPHGLVSISEDLPHP